MTAGRPGGAAPGLLAVFAHPDDESIACGGLLARCAAEGVRVAVLSLTRGEAGRGSVAASMSGEALAARRGAELTAAAAALGVHDAVALDHADGMLPWIDAARLEDDIHAAIARTQPDVVVTFGPDGLYWHPDHVAVCERTTAVVARLGAAGPALYYVTAPPGQMRRIVDRAGGLPILPGLADPDAFGAHALPPTLVVHSGRFAARKLAAIRAHASQVADSAFMRIDEADAAALLGDECYRRADDGGAGPTFLDAMGTAPAAATLGDLPSPR